MFRDLYSFWVYVLSKPGKYGIKSCICYAFFFFLRYIYSRERGREKTHVGGWVEGGETQVDSALSTGSIPPRDHKLSKN